MLVRSVLLLSCCLVCTSVRAQTTGDTTKTANAAAPDAQSASAAERDAPSAPNKGAVLPSLSERREAVPVDHAALAAPATMPYTERRSLDEDPLFLPGAILVGTGAAALLTSLFTGLGAHSVYTSLERDCADGVCYGTGQSRIDSGHTLAVVSTVLTGVGIGAAGLGTALLLIAATRGDEAKPTLKYGLASVRLSGGPGLLGLGASAQF